jgi:hypothetical protein
VQAQLLQDLVLAGAVVLARGLVLLQVEREMGEALGACNCRNGREWISADSGTRMG